MTAIWSIGKSKRSTEQKARYISPGPCAYNPKTENKTLTPSWTMQGPKKRDLSMKSIAPGPGAYKPLLKVM